MALKAVTRLRIFGAFRKRFGSGSWRKGFFELRSK
jgi:hypothetical protein